MIAQGYLRAARTDERGSSVIHPLASGAAQPSGISGWFGADSVGMAIPRHAS